MATDELEALHTRVARAKAQPFPAAPEGFNPFPPFATPSPQPVMPACRSAWETRASRWSAFHASEMQREYDNLAARGPVPEEYEQHFREVIVTKQDYAKQH